MTTHFSLYLVYTPLQYYFAKQRRTFCTKIYTLSRRNKTFNTRKDKIDVKVCIVFVLSSHIHTFMNLMPSLYASGLLARYFSFYNIFVYVCECAFSVRVSQSKLPSNVTNVNVVGRRLKIWPTYLKSFLASSLVDPTVF